MGAGPCSVPRPKQQSEVDVPLIAVGKRAPAFAMTSQDGGRVTLDQYAGKYVLLWWYPKADTPG
jgi:peroxiredoxin Q/BCP